MIQKIGHSNHDIHERNKMFGRIIGTGSYIPNNRVTNDDLAQIMDTSDEWISERTGIRARHIIDEETTAEMAVNAAKEALESASVDASEIDMIIVSTVSSNLILPNTACYVQQALGAENATCFDINTACTGFMVAYNTAQTYINSGIIKTALVIAAEGLSKIMDWSDRGTCILFGDGAGAAVIRKDEDAVFETVMYSDGGGKDALAMDNSFAARTNPFAEEQKEVKDYVLMDGAGVFRFAVDKVPKAIKTLLDQKQMDADEIDCYILHQANKRILQSITKRLKIDARKVPTNLEEYGNTSSACIPILLDELNKSGKINRGDKIIMSGFGAGLTWAATYLEF